ncbi:hypothetical protein CAEBREN_11508 [Caenorhabditis brenneri]|uniref:Uncharacterized protein n=1 Tax=Caenorhabditis brenneri TaxID=135651 RepID=G0MDY4_CAEBE|nr:hypothetical protein CAEBREN_11508 [Caenorhabditis brenneri]
MDRFQELTFTLCHYHHCCARNFGPNCANEYAKRGRTLCVEKSEDNPIEAGGSESNRVKDITQELAYQIWTLHNKRINT